MACACAEWLVSGLGLDLGVMPSPSPAIWLASHSVGLASHSAGLASPKKSEWLGYSIDVSHYYTFVPDPIWIISSSFDIFVTRKYSPTVYSGGDDDARIRRYGQVTYSGTPWCKSVQTQAIASPSHQSQPSQIQTPLGGASHSAKPVRTLWRYNCTPRLHPSFPTRMYNTESIRLSFRRGSAAWITLTTSSRRLEVDTSTSKVRSVGNARRIKASRVEAWVFGAVTFASGTRAKTARCDFFTANVILEVVIVEPKTDTVMCVSVDKDAEMILENLCVIWVNEIQLALLAEMCT
ncbi:hypothetical protein C8R43DRAFT_940587 [Mycena crocata]|nr:hypothetical protein C8R43DRAFT_940587 [Mycena crocata]